VGGPRRDILEKFRKCRKNAIGLPSLASHRVPSKGVLNQAPQSENRRSTFFAVRIYAETSAANNICVCNKLMCVFFILFWMIRCCLGNLRFEQRFIPKTNLLAYVSSPRIRSPPSLCFGTEEVEDIRDARREQPRTQVCRGS
jgi:hypothetical protein